MSEVKGYKLVPVEPTAEMIAELTNGGNSKKCITARYSYTLMLAAAPAPPQPIYDEAKERELFEDSHPGAFLDRRENGEYWNENYQCEWRGWKKCARSRAKAGEVGHE